MGVINRLWTQRLRGTANREALAAGVALQSQCGTWELRPDPAGRMFGVWRASWRGGPPRRLALCLSVEAAVLAMRGEGGPALHEMVEARPWSPDPV